MTLFNSSVDADRNGRLFDLLPAGNYCGVGGTRSASTTRAAATARGARAIKQTDMRFGYRFRPARDKTLDANFELFNIFNNANFANPGAAFGADKRLTDFLILTALRGGNGQPRAAQFSVQVRVLTTREGNATRRHEGTKARRRICCGRGRRDG